MNDVIPFYDTEKILDKINQGYLAEASIFLALVQSEGLSPHTMQKRVDQLTREGKKASTVNKNISAMRSVIRAVYETQQLPPSLSWEIEQNIWKVGFVKKQSQAVTEDQILSQGDYEKMLTGSPARIGLVIKFLWETGCRVSEAMRIRLTDCRLENGVTRIHITGKGRKERVLRIRPELFSQIYDLFEGENYLFESVRRSSGSGEKIPLHDRAVDKEIRRLGKEILGSGRNLHPHMLRHSFATRMIKAGVDVKAVSLYLGHSTTAITMDLYVHTEPTNEELGIF